jgi:peptide/nickel transport system substrate-binding protein
MTDGSDERLRRHFERGDESLSETLRDGKSRRRFLQALGVAGAAGLAGCSSASDGGGGTPTDTDTEGGGGDGSSSTDSSDGDGDGGSSGGSTFRMNAVQRFGTIDPAKGTDYTQTMALLNMYDGLVFPNADGELVPHLASDWSVSEDNLTYTFQIREDATFHSGNPVRAEDVKFTVERFFDINQGYASLLSGVLDKENVVAVDEHTVEFTLNRIHSPFLATLVLLFIVDKKAVLDNASDGEFGDRGDYGQEYLNNNDAGSGPYMLDSFERQSSISFAKYEDYWMGWPENSFDNVEIRIITEDPTVRTLMSNDELDMTSQYQSTETYETLRDTDGVRVEQIPTVTVFYMKINNQKPPTDDPAVREALSYGFDYETARNEIAPGSMQAQGPLAPSFGVHNGDIEQPTYDPERAQQVLADAGYSEGDLQIVNTYVQSNNMEERMALLFQQNMDQIGIDVELQPQTWGTMTELATSVEETPHTNHVFYGPVYPSPDTVFYNQYHSEAAETWMSMSHVQDDEIDSMIEEARATVDPDARAEIYADLQARLADMYAEMFVFVQAKQHGFSEDVGGYTYRPSQSYDYWFHDYVRE